MSANRTYADYLNNLSSEISYYFLIVSVPIGIPCNLISILIFRRLMRYSNNMGFLGMCQSIIDLTLLLSFLFLIRSSPLIFPQNLADLNDNLCRFLTYLRRFVIHASSWIPVVITFDRFTFVLFGHNHDFKFMKKKLNLLAIIFAIFILIALVDIPNLLFYVRDDLCTADFAIIIVADVISIAFRTYIPFTLLLIFNSCLIRATFKTWRSRQSSLRKSKQYQFTISVMFYDAYFFIINFPVSIYYILKDAYMYEFDRDAVLSSQFRMASAVILNLSYYEQTLTFFIYLMFNRPYRRELIRVKRKLFGALRKKFFPSVSTQNVEPINLIHIQSHTLARI